MLLSSIVHKVMEWLVFLAKSVSERQVWSSVFASQWRFCLHLKLLMKSRVLLGQECCFLARDMSRIFTSIRVPSHTGLYNVIKSAVLTLRL